MSQTLSVELPAKLARLYAAPRGSLRYRVSRGGRGSGKSVAAATMAAIWGATEPLRILCTRDLQNSIKESFHAELKQAIEKNAWLKSQYDVGRDYLRHKTNGTEFLFVGLRHNIDSIKSTAKIDLCIVEEAEAVPHASWIDLLPTIRENKSEIWVIYNPKKRDSWVAQNFDAETLPPRTTVIDINWWDNKWFPAVLDEQRQADETAMDPALYRHIWEGAYYERSAAQVLAHKYIAQEFTVQPEWDGPYIGLDFGFAEDPSAAVRCWIDGRRLYIDAEVYGHAVETEDMPVWLTTVIPEAASFQVVADSSRPETISHLKRHGIRRIIGAKKGAGSVEDGVAQLLSFERIIVNPACTNTINELELYSYKVDRLSGAILPTIVDANNHAIDAIRYALEPVRHGSAYTLKNI